MCTFSELIRLHFNHFYTTTWRIATIGTYADFKHELTLQIHAQKASGSLGGDA